MRPDSTCPGFGVAEVGGRAGAERTLGTRRLKCPFVWPFWGNPCFESAIGVREQ